MAKQLTKEFKQGQPTPFSTFEKAKDAYFALKDNYSKAEAEKFEQRLNASSESIKKEILQLAANLFIVDVGFKLRAPPITSAHQKARPFKSEAEILSSFDELKKHKFLLHKSKPWLDRLEGTSQEIKNGFLDLFVAMRIMQRSFSKAAHNKQNDSVTRFLQGLAMNAYLEDGPKKKSGRDQQDVLKKDVHFYRELQERSLEKRAIKALGTSLGAQEQKEWDKHCSSLPHSKKKALEKYIEWYNRTITDLGPPFLPS